MARTVTDLAKLLDAMVGYDPGDPVTAHGIGHAPESYAALLDRNALRGARIGILREPMGLNSDPNAEDFILTTKLFDEAIAELKDCGAVIVDPVVIDDLKPLLAKRAFGTPEGRKRSGSILRVPPTRLSARAKMRWPRRSSINCCRRPKSGGLACSRPVPP
jgi:Asp-tRNA(Asn)/Glu-tRNA(Gln) amidotransferase A subunit family amidase